MAKRLSASYIMEVMSRADPCNALKLTNTEEYQKVDYQDFFVVFSNEKYKDKFVELNKLQEEMNELLLHQEDYHFRTDKLYEFFILRLQGILGKR